MLCYDWAYKSVVWRFLRSVCLYAVCMWYITKMHNDTHQFSSFKLCKLTQTDLHQLVFPSMNRLKSTILQWDVIFLLGNLICLLTLCFCSVVLCVWNPVSSLRYLSQPGNQLPDPAVLLTVLCRALFTCLPHCFLPLSKPVKCMGRATTTDATITEISLTKSQNKKYPGSFLPKYSPSPYTYYREYITIL